MTHAEFCRLLENHQRLVYEALRELAPKGNHHYTDAIYRASLTLRDVFASDYVRDELTGLWRRSPEIS
jgi:hypothetical protein